MTASIRSDIADALLNRIATVADIKYKAFDEVRLLASDFSDHEIPAVQIFDLQEVTIHENRRARKTWRLVVEIIIGPNGISATPTQKDLWDMMQTIEQAIWAEPRLGLPQVIHARLITTSTDLHLMKPFYLGRLEMEIDYYQPLVGDC